MATSASGCSCVPLGQMAPGGGRLTSILNEKSEKKRRRRLRSAFYALPTQPSEPSATKEQEQWLLPLAGLLAGLSQAAHPTSGAKQIATVRLPLGGRSKTDVPGFQAILADLTACDAAGELGRIAAHSSSPVAQGAAAECLSFLFHIRDNVELCASGGYLPSLIALLLSAPLLVRVHVAAALSAACTSSWDIPCVSSLAISTCAPGMLPTAGDDPVPASSGLAAVPVTAQTTSSCEAPPRKPGGSASESRQGRATGRSKRVHPEMGRNGADDELRPPLLSPERNTVSPEKNILSPAQNIFSPEQSIASPEQVNSSFQQAVERHEPVIAALLRLAETTEVDAKGGVDGPDQVLTVAYMWRNWEDVVKTHTSEASAAQALAPKVAASARAAAWRCLVDVVSACCHSRGNQRLLIDQQGPLLVPFLLRALSIDFRNCSESDAQAAAAAARCLACLCRRPFPLWQEASPPDEGLDVVEEEDDGFVLVDIAPNLAAQVLNVLHGNKSSGSDDTAPQDKILGDCKTTSEASGSRGASHRRSPSGGAVVGATEGGLAIAGSPLDAAGPAVLAAVVAVSEAIDEGGGRQGGIITTRPLRAALTLLLDCLANLTHAPSLADSLTSGHEGGVKLRAMVDAAAGVEAAAKGQPNSQAKQHPITSASLPAFPHEDFTHSVLSFTSPPDKPPAFTCTLSLPFGPATAPGTSHGTGPLLPPAGRSKISLPSTTGRTAVVPLRARLDGTAEPAALPPPPQKPGQRPLAFREVLHHSPPAYASMLICLANMALVTTSALLPEGFAGAAAQQAAAARQRGNDALHSGDPSYALVNYNAALRLIHAASVQDGYRYPDRHLLWSNRAEACLRSGLLKEALHDVDQALALDSSHLKSQLRRQRALEGLEKYARGNENKGVLAWPWRGLA